MSAVADIRALNELLALHAATEQVLRRRHARLMHIKEKLLLRAAAWRQIRHEEAGQRQQRLVEDRHTLFDQPVATTCLAGLASNEAWNAWETQQAERGEQLWRSRIASYTSLCMDIESRLRAFHKRSLALSAMKFKQEGYLADQRERLEEEAAMDLAAFRHIRGQ